MIPVGLDEGDELLARRSEIDDRLLRQHLDGALRFDRARILLAFVGRAAQACDLIIQRRVHVEQRAGDVEQRALVGLAAAFGHVAQCVALLLHDIARHAQAHHAQGVGDVAQFGNLLLQRCGIAARAQVQIQRVLDPQQFFLDRAAHRVEQFAVASADAAARVIDFLGARLRRLGCLGSRREQHAFVQSGRAAGVADFVEQRQQHDRDVAMAVLQALQVVRQQYRAAHQGGAGLLAVGDVPFLQCLRQLFQLLGDHRRGIQFHHPQRALDLVKVTGAEPHPAAVGRGLDERLDLAARQAQRLVQLGFDPTQDGMAHGLAQRAHRHAPSASERQPVRDGCHAVEIRAFIRAFRPQPGSLKSATERRRSAASCARWPIESAVCLAPSEVCEVIWRITPIVSVMSEAAADCCWAAPEMFLMRSLRSLDTRSISPSAVPASSARRAPDTTSAVVCSIELTASLVSA